MNAKKHRFCLSLLGLCCLMAACTPVSSVEPAVRHSETSPAPWVIATWNVEHLAYPPDTGCKPRSASDLAALQDYARQLNADVIALQEVASVQAVSQLFPATDWQLFLSDRPDSEPYECRESGSPSTQQKVAWAVRNTINVTRVQPHPQFGLDLPGLRHGLELIVDSPLGELRLLNVHLKSGCFVDNYSRADSEACQIFARQAPVLDQWVEDRERDGIPYLLTGDFNHRLSAPYNHLTRQLNNNETGSRSTLINTTAPLISCHPWYPAPIDHIFVGHLPVQQVDLKADTVAFIDMTVDGMLSDHCAMRLTMHLSPAG